MKNEQDAYLKAHNCKSKEEVERKLTPVLLSDELLIKNGFENSHNDLLAVNFNISTGFKILEMMKINNGYWAILSSRSSGEETDRINLGQYLYLYEIEMLVNALKNGR